MKNLKKSHWVLIVFSILILLGCIGMTAFLLFSNYQNIRLFKQAQNNFRRNDPESLAIAEVQLQQVIRNDDDNEAAYIMLGEIAEKQKNYSEQVYYCYMAHRLNPLSRENKEAYIRSLWFARYFDRLEIFLKQQHDLSDEWKQLLLYSAGRNGNFGKYKKLEFDHSNPKNSVRELAFLLFDNKKLNPEAKLSALKKIPETEFITQEILTAQAEFHLESGNLDGAEKALQEAYELNFYAYTLPLGNFYANYRSLGKALTVFEKYLAKYHDPIVALQCAEIYCLLKRTAGISKLRNFYQSDTGSSAMLLCYYFDALSAFAKNDMAALKELLIPLRKKISTPLALFMFFCSDIQGNNISAITESYTTLISRDDYMDLQSRADEMLSDYLKRSVAEKRNNEELLLPLANLLHSRRKDIFTAKFILLTQRRNAPVNISLLKDSLKRYPHDQGIIKIAIEYHLKNDLDESKHLIAYYKQKFPQKANDMLRYELFLASRKNDHELVSKLFRENFSAEILPDYWNFASSMMRKNDLIFLSRNKLYEPFCKALLLLQKNERNAACDLLEKADARGNLPLLFFAAKTLAENGRNRKALEKYALFPADSDYKLTVLLNTAEIIAETGNTDRALELAAQAYKMAPDLENAQICYADKLHRSGNLKKIPDVIKLKPASLHRRKMESLWISGMQQRIKESDSYNQREKTRELCRQLLSVAPDNHIALEYLKKLNRMQK